MRTAPIAPYVSGEQPGQDGFAALLRAEWTKFKTVRGWVIAATAVAVVIVVIIVMLWAHVLRRGTRCRSGLYRHDQRARLHLGARIEDHDGLAGFQAWPG